jgi:hypothetical protein
MGKPVYMEIVHVTEEELKEGVRYTNYKPIIDRIRHLEKKFGIHFVPDRLEGNLPDVPRDTTILVGGTLWGKKWCIQRRVDILQGLGYRNARACRSLSFKGEEPILPRN